MYTKRECAALDKARMILENKARYSAMVLNDPRAISLYLSTRYINVKREVLIVLFMNSNHELIEAEDMFKGTIDAASVYPRPIVQRALELNAAAVVMAHNHPSGNPEPSEADKRITLRVRDALSLLDIRLLDHFVIGQGSNQCVSMAERGML